MLGAPASVALTPLGKAGDAYRFAQAGFGEFSLTPEGAELLRIAPGLYRAGMGIVGFSKMHARRPKQPDILRASVRNSATRDTRSLRLGSSFLPVGMARAGGRMLS